MTPDHEHVAQRFLEALCEHPLEGQVNVDNRRWAQLRLKEIRNAARKWRVEATFQETSSSQQQAFLFRFMSSIADMRIGPSTKSDDMRVWAHRRIAQIRQAARAWRDHQIDSFGEL